MDNHVENFLAVMAMRKFVRDLPPDQAHLFYRIAGRCRNSMEFRNLVLREFREGATARPSAPGLDIEIRAAMSYALGRESAPVSAMVDWIKAVWPNLQPGTRTAIVSDIEAAISCRAAGGPPEIALWKGILVFAKETAEKCIVIDDLRAAAAQSAYQAYDFGLAAIESSPGWEHDVSADEWIRAIFIESEDPSEQAKVGHFCVRFESGTAIVEEAYGMLYGNLLARRLALFHDRRNPMPLMQMLDLWAGHITSKDAKLLEGYRVETNPFDKALFAYPFECGWTISISGMLDSANDRFEIIDKLRLEGFSEYFVNMMCHAADLGAVLVRLDRDADYEPGLPRFDWEHGDEIDNGRLSETLKEPIMPKATIIFKVPQDFAPLQGVIADFPGECERIDYQELDNLDAQLQALIGEMIQIDFDEPHDPSKPIDSFIDALKASGEPYLAVHESYTEPSRGIRFLGNIRFRTADFRGDRPYPWQFGEPDIAEPETFRSAGFTLAELRSINAAFFPESTPAPRL